MFTVKWKIAFWWEWLQVCTDLQNNICSLTLSNFQFQLKWNLTGILFGGKKSQFHDKLHLHLCDSHHCHISEALTVWSRSASSVVLWIASLLFLPAFQFKSVLNFVVAAIRVGYKIMEKHLAYKQATTISLRGAHVECCKTHEYHHWYTSRRSTLFQEGQRNSYQQNICSLF